MLKALADLDGRKTYVIGLTWGNLAKFRAAPGDSYIRIPKEESGLPVDILIFSDKTEAAMVDFLAPFIDAGTNVIVSDKLKQ